jgi:cytoskeletal protein RodZ
VTYETKLANTNVDINNSNRVQVPSNQIISQETGARVNNYSYIPNNQLNETVHVEPQPINTVKPIVDPRKTVEKDNCSKWIWLAAALLFLVLMVLALLWGLGAFNGNSSKNNLNSGLITNGTKTPTGTISSTPTSNYPTTSTTTTSTTPTSTTPTTSPTTTTTTTTTTTNNTTSVTKPATV